MANLITEVFVSIDGLEFTKLDLHKDESIPIRQTTKDLQDISKIFSPYSLDFTFQASSKNRRAFGFFGDTDVIKINPDNKFITKIYTDGSINLKGFIRLTDLSYINKRPTDFTGSFATSMTNLADRIGDDLITELTDEIVTVDWSPRNVFNLMKGANNTTVDGVPISYFVPLISNNRVLAFDSNIESAVKDNVSYDTLVPPDSEGTIKTTELRPCMSFSTVIELIKLKYNLDVIAPLDLRKEYTELVIWCNSENLFDPSEVKLPINSNFGNLFSYARKHESGIPDPKKYVATTNVFDDTFKVTRRDPPTAEDNNYTKFLTAQIKFEGVIITGNDSDPKVNLKVRRKNTDEILVSKQFDLVDNEFFCEMQILDDFFINNEIEYYITVQFEQATSWSNCYYQTWFKYYDGKTGWLSSKEYATYAYESVINNNSAAVGGTNIDLIKSLPEIKVLDFLKSYFKIFNISVFDTSPNDDRLFWLAPEDVQTSGLAYSKATLDYTDYVDSKESKKSVPNEFNYYNFKHQTSKYRSSIDYFSINGVEYGQAVHPAIKPPNTVEFKVETNFTLMVPVILVGSNNIITYYGFDGDSPEILETGESRYSPNLGELTIFYNAGNTPLSNTLGFQSTNISGGLINAALTSYMKVVPFNTQASSLAFSVLREQNIEYPESIYKRYYQVQTERLLDPNVLSQEFSLVLPPDEIYLNNATTIQGGGETPKGFRLQNDIIIGENLFTILDSTIDITTGDTKLTLLNF